MKANLFKSSIILIMLSLLSRILGFGRDAIIASRFGATYDTDIYFFSLNILILLFAGIGSGLNITFMPIFTGIIQGGDKTEENKFINNVLTIITGITILVTILSVIFSKYYVYLFAPGFRENAEVILKATNTLKIMFFSLILIGIQYILSSVLQSYRLFIIPGTINVILNAVIIIYLFFFSAKYGIYGLALATVIAYVLQVIVHIPSIKKLGYKLKLYINIKDKNVNKVFLLMFPVVFGSSILQIGTLVDRVLATTLGEGSVSIMNYAEKLSTFSYGIVIVTIVPIVYSNLSMYIAKQDFQSFNCELTRAINLVFITMIPITITLIVLRNDFITILFKRGAFNEHTAELTATVFMLYSPSMIMFGVKDILNRAFYSIQNTRTPMINSIFGIIIGIILDLLLIRRLRIFALPISSSIATITSTIFLFISLKRKYRVINYRGISISLCKTVVASIAMGLSLLYLRGLNKNIIYNPLVTSIINFSVNSIISMLVYLILLHLMKVREYEDLASLIRKKFIRKSMSYLE